MAKKKGNGRDEAALGLFHEMLDELRALRTGQDELRSHARETNDRLGRVEARLDNIRDLAGDQYRRLDDRVSRIESKLSGH